MKAVLNIKLGLLAITSVYALYAFPIGYSILVACFAVISYVVTYDLSAPLGTVIIMIIVRWIGNVLKSSKDGFQSTPPAKIPPPKKTEGFQAKDPISIHQRIAGQKKVAPKAGEPMGVLESPDILDNVHISDIKGGEEGFTNETVPASLNMTNQHIPTPAESSMPNSMGATPAPMANPALIGGRDLEGEYTATNTLKGSSLITNDSSNVKATNMGMPASYA
jgi:hypothetical protein